MQAGDFREQIGTMRRYILAGAQSFTLGPLMLATLIDESDSLSELYRYGEAYGVQKLLKVFKGDDERIGSFFNLLHAEQVGKTHHKVRFESYVGCFWLNDGEWNWYPETLDGQVVETPLTLVETLIRQGV